MNHTSQTLFATMALFFVQLHQVRAKVEVEFIEL